MRATKGTTLIQFHCVALAEGIKRIVPRATGRDRENGRKKKDGKHTNAHETYGTKRISTSLEERLERIHTHLRARARKLVRFRSRRTAHMYLSRCIFGVVDARLVPHDSSRRDWKGEFVFVQQIFKNSSP